MRDDLNDLLGNLVRVIPENLRPDNNLTLCSVSRMGKDLGTDKEIDDGVVINTSSMAAYYAIQTWIRENAKGINYHTYNSMGNKFGFYAIPISPHSKDFIEERCRSSSLVSRDQKKLEEYYIEEVKNIINSTLSRIMQENLGQEIIENSVQQQLTQGSQKLTSTDLLGAIKLEKDLAEYLRKINAKLDCRDKQKKLAQENAELAKTRITLFGKPQLDGLSGNQTHLERFKNYINQREESYSQACSRLNLEMPDHLMCSITFNIPNIPVLLNGRLYDLEALDSYATTEGRRIDPNTREIYTLNNVQPARFIVDAIEKLIAEANTLSLAPGTIQR